MMAIRRDLAAEAFGKLPLSRANRQLADYWLSLWRDDQMPYRADFSPGKIRDHLPGIALFDVRAGESVRCRLAGTIMHRAVGRELTGLDWRDYTAKDHWAERLARNTLISEGAIGIGTRYSQNADGMQVTQELQLPFADVAADGAKLLLFHLDWRPRDVLHRPNSGAIKVADEFVTRPLAA